MWAETIEWSRSKFLLPFCVRLFPTSPEGQTYWTQERRIGLILTEKYRDWNDFKASLYITSFCQNHRILSSKSCILLAFSSPCLVILLFNILGYSIPASQKQPRPPHNSSYILLLPNSQNVLLIGSSTIWVLLSVLLDLKKSLHVKLDGSRCGHKVGL